MLLSNTMIQNLTFIVIARNENFAIQKCLNSINSLNLKNCEIICIDSDSSDGTFDIMKKFAQENSMGQAFQISGRINSAIARNAGIKRVTKKYIFFIDGDIEIFQDFLLKSLSYLKNNKADIITGQLSEILYDDKYQNIIHKVQDRFGITKEKAIYYSGGSFITKSKIVNQVGLFDETFVRNQDIEYTFRLSKGHKFIGIPEKMGIHHTLQYRSRPIEFLIQLYPMYFGIILRRNIFERPTTTFKFLINNSGFLSGIFFYFFFMLSLFLFSFGVLDESILIITLTSFVAADMVGGLIKRQSFFDRFIIHYIYPIVIFWGFMINKYNLKNNNSL